MIRAFGVIAIVAGAMSATEVRSHESPPPVTVANEIRQIPLDPGLPVQFMYNLNDTGSQQVAAPIEGTGALFELWADGEGDDAGTKTLVDSKVIGLYMPKGIFNIDVKDKNWIGSVTDHVSGKTVQRPVYRTRADQPFSVTGTVANLLTDPTAPRAAREVNFLHLGTPATTGGYLVELDNQQTLQSLVFTGSDTFNYTGPSLPGFASDITLRNGEEKFEMRSYADETVSARWNVGSAIVKIFPVGTGVFMQQADDGGQAPFVDGQVFNDRVRDIFVHYTSVYPDSKTYVQIYKGEPSLGTVGGVVSVTVLNAAGAVEPQDTKTIYSAAGITIKDSYLQPFFEQGGSGVYTLEIIASDMPADFTNGGSERLAVISFTLNRSLRVKGQIGAK